MAKKLRIKLVRSPITCKPAHRATLRALGLHRIGAEVEQADAPQIRGMINRVVYLLQIEEIDAK